MVGGVYGVFWERDFSGDFNVCESKKVWVCNKKV